MSSHILVVVAHADDETLGFGGLIQQHVDAGNYVEVVLVTDCTGFDPPRSLERHKEFARACGMLGVQNFHIFDLPDIFEERLDLHAIWDLLTALQVDKERPFDDVYTHGIWEEHWHHQDIAIAVAMAFDSPVWFRANIHETGDIKFIRADQRKLDVLNACYVEEMEDGFEEKAIAMTEMFRRVRQQEAIAQYSIMRNGEYVAEWMTDMWGLFTSPYEQRRHEAALALIEKPTRILELGACEGSFTHRLLDRFPDTEVIAYEPNPILRSRIKSHVNLSTLPFGEYSHTLALEVLYYDPDWMQTVKSVDSPYFITSAYAEFAERIDRYLPSLGWKKVREASVPKCVEMFAGQTLIRIGSEIVLWERHSITLT